MKYIDALIDAMNQYDLKPRIQYEKTRTKVFINRKIGVINFDNPKKSYTPGYSWYEYANPNDAMKPFTQPDKPARYAKFWVSCDDGNELYRIWSTLQPIADTIANMRIKPDKNEIMGLGI